MHLVNAIIGNKRPVIAESEITLFEHCELNCAFCGHDKNSTVGMSREEILKKADITINHMKKMHADKIPFYQLNIVGGELFSDTAHKLGLYEYYKELVHILNDKAKYFKFKEFTVAFVSNFLMSTDALDDLVILLKYIRSKDIKVNVIASYDFSGRVVDSRWKYNLNKLSDFVSSVNCVMTAPSMKKFIKGNNAYFDFIYNKYEVYFDYFIPDKGTDYLIPKDSLLLDVLKKIHSDYPNIHPFKELFKEDNLPVHTSCLSLNKITIFPDNSTSNCRWKRYTDDDYRTKINYDDNRNMILDFIATEGCMVCDYFERCTLRCSNQWSWNNRVKDLDDCALRIFFKHIS